MLVDHVDGAGQGLCGSNHDGESASAGRRTGRGCRQWRRPEPARSSSQCDDNLHVWPDLRREFQYELGTPRGTAAVAGIEREKAQLPCRRSNAVAASGSGIVPRSSGNYRPAGVTAGGVARPAMALAVSVDPRDRGQALGERIRLLRRLDPVPSGHRSAPSPAVCQLHEGLLSPRAETEALQMAVTSLRRAEAHAWR